MKTTTPLPLFRVHYEYTDRGTDRVHKFSQLVPAETSEAATAQFLSLMLRDGIPADRVMIGRTVLEALN